MKYKQSQLQLSFIAFMFLLLLSQLFVYLIVYEFQFFSLTLFVTIDLFLLGGLIGFLFGLLPALMYSVVYIVVGVIANLTIPDRSEFLTYLSLVFLPLVTLLGAYIHMIHKQNDLYVEQLIAENAQSSKVDAITKLPTGDQLYQLIVKQAYLAKRYESYTFSLAMIRIDFLQTTKASLGERGYSQLTAEISQILQRCIRQEDYKFLLQDGVFILLLPLTKQAYFQHLATRIQTEFEQIECYDQNNKRFIPTIRNGVIEYETEHFNDFQKLETIILRLQKQTEVDIVLEH